jgi:FtsZ-binding cell division protein ZapB
VSKAPSPATQIRTLKRENAELRNECHRWKNNAVQYRERANKAEQEVAEWKLRFDALLKIVPPTPQSDRE